MHTLLLAGSYLRCSRYLAFYEEKGDFSVTCKTVMQVKLSVPQLTKLESENNIDKQLVSCRLVVRTQM